MTEVPPSQEPLETTVATTSQKVEQPEKIKPLTLTELIGGLAKGLIPLAVGTAGGYWVTGGPGGAGTGLFLTSLGMEWLRENDISRSGYVADFCYGTGVVVGVAMGLITIYINGQQHKE
ncbi:MAG TPA: hypothetical protein VJH37_04315 [Candidatus Nanoarchaeia archaeon]|nr:hypothetical protein [Candidatus Nanoarchaeia archaeon]